MKKRQFLKISGLMAVGAMMAPISSCGNEQQSKAKTTDTQASNGNGPFSLPDLPYPAEALEPHIDVQTMQIHHGKHHAGYVRKLNAALEGSELGGKSLAELMASIGQGDTAIRNSGGGHFNHNLFWKVMAPNAGGEPSGDLADAINSSFGSFSQFQEIFSNAAKTRFGSGWAWLYVGQNNKLQVSSTPNQDNPLMENIVSDSGTPILGIDVWEHAYYLKYQNRRGDYVSNWWNLINWNEVANNLSLVAG